MNRFLANSIGWINSLVAWVLVIGSTVAGTYYSGGAVGFIVGLLIGFVFAVLLCGMLALLIDIRNSVREIAGATNVLTSTNNPPASAKGKPWEHSV